MRVNEIYEQTRPNTFMPMRLYISDGATYEVTHPEMIWVTQREVLIDTKLSRHELPDKIVRCDPLHITRIESLEEDNAG